VTEQTAVAVLADLGVTERVARAIDPGAFTDWSGAHDPRALGEQQRRQADARTNVTAALAAVAECPGLEEALRKHKHRTVTESVGVTYYCACTCGWLDATGPDHAAHLADVVWAWLRGEWT